MKMWLRIACLVLVVPSMLLAEDNFQTSSDVRPDGYDFSLQTETETREESAKLVPLGEDQSALRVEGSASWIDLDGNQVSFSYTADENGYHPTGDILPTPTPLDQLPPLLRAGILRTQQNPPLTE